MSLPTAAYRWRGTWASGREYCNYDVVLSPATLLTYVLDNGFRHANSVADPSTDPLWKVLNPPPPSTYAITANTLSINESGLPVVFTLVTTYVPDGTQLYWENIESTTSVDFVENVNNGYLTVTSNTATLTLTIRADDLTEGTETIGIRISDAPGGTVLATSHSVTVNDTSVTRTWTITTTSFSSNKSTEVDTSADGSKILVVTGGNSSNNFLDVGRLYINSTSGTGGWSSPTVSPEFLNGGCVSRNGQFMYAGGHANVMVRSTNGGASWVNTGPGGIWNGFATSDDGQTAYAVGGYTNSNEFTNIYVTNNGGTTWAEKLRVPPQKRRRFLVVCSGDGVYALTGAISGGTLEKTSDSGATWVDVGPSLNWFSFACSASGQLMYASASGSLLYKSTDYGVTWSAIVVPQSFVDIDASDDGSVLVGISTTKFYVSQDGGLTWTDVYTNPGNVWTNVTCTANGALAYIASNNGPVYRAVYA